MSPLHEIVTADDGDVEVLSQLIALSFRSLDPSVWLIPDTAERARLLPGYFQLIVADALARGHVDTTPDRTAVALWFPVGEDVPAGPSGYEAGLPGAVGPWLEQFRTFDKHLAARHPAGRHDHLAILAVLPTRQRRGWGGELLAGHHKRLDWSDPPVAAYLEASDAQTRQFYLARGYADHGDPIRLPHGPAMYPMLRPAALADA